MKCLFNEAIAELNGTFHLSPSENVLTIARMKTFIVYSMFEPAYLQKEWSKRKTVEYLSR